MKLVDLSQTIADPRRSLETGFTFHAVPAKVAGAAAFPVRAYAIVADNQT